MHFVQFRSCFHPTCSSPPNPRGCVFRAMLAYHVLHILLSMVCVHVHNLNLKQEFSSSRPKLLSAPLASRFHVLHLDSLYRQSTRPRRPSELLVQKPPLLEVLCGVLPCVVCLLLFPPLVGNRFISLTDIHTPSNLTFVL